jgi:hypothetical protein
VLDVGYERRVEGVADYLGRFHNLLTSGRNGRFAYTHLHDMMRWGHDLVASLAGDGSLAEPPVSVPLPVRG